MKDSITDLLKRFAVKMMRPVIEEWPILTFYILWVGWSSLLQNPFYRWFVIFLHAYLAATLVCLAKSKIAKGLVYLAAFTLFLIEAMLENCYGLAISPGTLLLLEETSAREAQEFLGALPLRPAFWLTVATAIATASLAWWAERRRLAVAGMLRKAPTYRWLAWAAACLLAVGLAGSMCYVRLLQCDTTDEVSAWNLHMRYPSDAATRTVIALFDLHLAGRETERAIRQAELVEATRITDTVNVILVIGESFIRQHAPLYGYPLNTTPFMRSEQERGRLVAFTDAVAPYNLTTLAVRQMMSCNSMADGESWADKPPLAAIFKSAGFYVSMYDNQRTFSYASTQTFALNNYLYHPKVQNSCYNETNKETFDLDGDLISHYRQQERNEHPRRLSIFHLMGQHAQFNARYPSDDPRFNHFTSDSLAWRTETWMTNHKKAIIASYDNATLYNDYVTGQIIGLYDDENTVAVYLSDHGEEVYDYRDNIGRSKGKDLSQLLDYQYGVPLVVWCSDRYRQKHPEVISLLRKAVNRPLTTDNTCQLLFHLAGLTKTPYYQPKRDVLSPDYECGRRIVNDQYDYDVIVKKKRK